MSDLELINKAAHRIYPTHLKEHEKGSSFSWSDILPVDAKSRIVKDSEGHKQTDDRNSHTLTHKLKGGASIEFNIVQNGKNHIAMAKYHKGGKLYTAIHSHEDPNKAMKTAYDSVARRIVTEEAEIALIEKMEKRIEKKTGKLSDKKEKIDVEPSEEKELKEGTIEVIPHFVGVMPDGRKVSPFSAGVHHVEKTGKWTWGVTDHNGNYTTGMSRQPVESREEAIRIAHEVAAKTLHRVKLHESTPPGMESWVKKNKARFVKEYGEKKGHEVLYATAWKLHNKMNEEELNELSKKTLASYIKQASHHARRNEYYAGRDHGKNQQESDKELEVSRKRQKGIEKAANKLAESHTYTKEGLAKQIKYHENRAAHHDSEAQASFNKAQDLAGDKADLHFNAAKGHKAIADLHRKHIYDLKSAAGLTEAEGKVEMMYLSKGFISPKLAEKLVRESKHLGTDKSTGEQHYLHPRHGRMALVPHKPSGQFQFRLAEEIEQLDELSPHTLGSYIKHAAIQKGSGAASQAINRRAQYDAETRGDKKGAEQYKQAADKDSKKQDKRFAGIMRATDKLVHKTIKEEQLEETRVAPHPDKVVMTSSIRKDLGGGYMAKTRNGHFYKLNIDAFGEPGKGRELPKLGVVLDTSKHKFIGKDKVDLNLLKESLEESLRYHEIPSYLYSLGNELGTDLHFHKESRMSNPETGTRDYVFHTAKLADHVKARIKKDYPEAKLGMASYSQYAPEHQTHVVVMPGPKIKAKTTKSIKEELDDSHPDMKAYHAACKARDEAHLASIRYRMHHDIKQPEHRAKYDELEAEHHRLRDIEDAIGEKVNGRLFAHHATKK